MRELRANEAFELWQANKKNKNSNLVFYKYSFLYGELSFQEKNNQPITSFKKDKAEGYDGWFYINREDYLNRKDSLTPSQVIFACDNPKERPFILARRNIKSKANKFADIKINPLYYLFLAHDPDRQGYLRENPMDWIKSIVKSLAELMALGLNLQKYYDELNSLTIFYPANNNENYNDFYQHYFDMLAELVKYLDSLEVPE